MAVPGVQTNSELSRISSDDFLLVQHIAARSQIIQSSFQVMASLIQVLHAVLFFAHQGGEEPGT
jgi:hypothetical protein